jgi:Tat protein translocase TatB subunit
MEMLVIFVVALLVLGPSKLPEAGRQVGRALAEFRRWSSGVQSELRDALDVDLDPDYGEQVPEPADTVPELDRDTTPHPRPPSTFPDQQSFT